MNIPKINASNAGFQGLKFKNAKNLLYATAASMTILGAVSNSNAQDVPRYGIGSGIGVMVRYEDYRALELKYQQALAERAEALDSFSYAPTETENNYGENAYINPDKLVKHYKKNLMGSSILEALGFFVVGTLASSILNIFKKND